MLSDKKMRMNTNNTSVTVEEASRTAELRIAVCDDEASQLRKLMCLFDALEVNVSLRLEYFSSAQVLLKELEEKKEKGENTPEVIFCDISMPGMDGIAFGKEIRRVCPDIYFVLCTAYSEYAIQGYETRAFRYLLKPVEASEVERVLLAVLQEKGRDRKLLIRTSDGENVIALSEIVYFGAEDKYTIIYTKKEHCIDRTSLNEFERLLEPYGFCRIHRKYIVNLAQHKNMGRGKVTLLDGTALPISRRRESAYRSKLVGLLGEELLI